MMTLYHIPRHCGTAAMKTVSLLSVLNLHAQPRALRLGPVTAMIPTRPVAMLRGNGVSLEMSIYAHLLTAQMAELGQRDFGSMG